MNHFENGRNKALREINIKHSILNKKGDVGVRWVEFDTKGNQKTKEKIFSTVEALNRFIDKLKTTGNDFDVQTFTMNY